MGKASTKPKKRPNKVAEAVKEELKQPLLKLNLGAGKSKIEGYIGVDSIRFDATTPDVVANLNDAWPWADNSVSHIHMSHVLEHFSGDQRVHVFNEIFRVMAPGGQAYIVTPHWASNRAYGDFTHCFSEDTEILMESGWKPINAVKLGERALAMDLETERTSFEPVIRTIDMPYVGAMLHFNTEAMDMMVTPNHDMVWRSKGNGNKYRTPDLKKSPAEEFSSMGGHHPRRAIGTVDWDGEQKEEIRIAEDEYVNGHCIKGAFKADDFCEFLGWFVSEGNVDISKGHYRIQIAQSQSANPEKFSEIVSLCNRMGLKPTIYKDRIRVNSKPLAKYLCGLGNRYEKFVPPEIKGLSSSLLRRFLDSAIKGDGRKNGNGWEYATTSNRLSTDMHEVALKAGYRSAVRMEKRKGVSHKLVINGQPVSELQDLYMVSICQPKHLWYPVPQKVNYSGHIVCVTLAAKNNIYVRRNGKSLWSGNCWPPVSEMLYYYTNREWRIANAPHCDIAHNPKGYNCDFGFNTGYGIHPEIQNFPADRQMFEMKWYKEACTDFIVTLETNKK